LPAQEEMARTSRCSLPNEAAADLAAFDETNPMGARLNMSG
jgi:hypothetical protein